MNTPLKKSALNYFLTGYLFVFAYGMVLFVVKGKGSYSWYDAIVGTVLATALVSLLGGLLGLALGLLLERLKRPGTTRTH